MSSEVGVWDYYLKHPGETLALLFGGGAVAAAIGMLSKGEEAIGMAFGALGTVILVATGVVIFRSDSWDEPVDQWGAVATDSRQRLNFLLAGLGILIAGVAAIWFGFTPGRLVLQIILIGTGTLIFIMGVVCIVGWVKARSLFG